MASSITFNSVQQQNQLFSHTLCKCPSSLHVFNFHSLSLFLPSSSSLPKHTPLFLVRAALHAKLPTTHHETSKSVTLRTRKRSPSRFSSLSTRDARVEKESVKNDFGSVVEQNTHDRFTKDKNARKQFVFRKRRQVGSENENLGMKSSKTVDNQVSNGKMEKKTNNSGHYKVRAKNKENLAKKKSKTDPSEVEFRVALDMCSKRGDVIGAIQLYDKAQKEGIKLGQYHYTVFLYLCSSAAIGVVKPAKSGSRSRTLETLGMSSEASTVNSVHLGEIEDRDNLSYGVTELDIPVQNKGQLVDNTSNNQVIDNPVSNFYNTFDDLDGSFSEKENLTQFSSKSMKPNSQHFDGLSISEMSNDEKSHGKDKSSGNRDDCEIRLSEDVKKFALQRGFEIYEKMCLDNVPMNEASLTAVGRMAMSMGNGDMAFDMVKRMKPLGINPRLRSYGPALSVFCNTGNIDKAFAVEKHMLEHGVYPEEPELERLLRLSVVTGKGDKVYYLLHKLRASVRKVSPSTAETIVKWFNSKEAATLGKTKWDHRLVKKSMEDKGGGGHELGWLGKGKWAVSQTAVGADALCQCCGEKLVMIDLDPIETENFAESVASIAIKREKNSSFQKFQKWLDYYGPFEAVVDAANIGLFSQRKFKPSRVNVVVNGIRQKLPSKKWPLIVLHNKRITGDKMDEPINKALIEKWKNADALYSTPTGSNDDWYWLYAAIKFKCLLVTNDEMRDHTFHLLGNDFFPRWKERHQVRFGFSDAGPEFYMPPPYSVVIQESEKGNWHIPIASEHDYEAERTWLCITRANSRVSGKDSATIPEDLQSLDHNKGQAWPTTSKEVKIKSHSSGNTEKLAQKEHKNLTDILQKSMSSDNQTILSKIVASEELGNCLIDFQI
ncbi:hypothetical protein LWI28_021804 [Acer negundo]|uniref:ribonuclease P n=1 Tax=Acer negundo TaxID=4023 RepID=A0AAD5JBA9_ACENE|nr:hypothetical protein LWI28_021804 [Acer negundo]